MPVLGTNCSARKLAPARVFDCKDSNLANTVVKTIGNDNFAGIFDGISNESTFSHDLQILERIGGGRIAATHPPPQDLKLPDNTKTSGVFAVGDYAFPLWENFVARALESGQLKCMPKPLIVGKGLENVQTRLEAFAKGVSGQKVFVEL